MRGRRRFASVLTAVTGLIMAPTLVNGIAAIPASFSVENAPAKPVALVFGAAVEPSGRPSAYLRARLDIAVQLFRAGKVKVILVSGDNRTRYYDEPTAMKKYLVAQGVPERVIVADYAGFDTYDSCVRAKEIFGVTSLIAISQSYHVPRILMTCRSVGVNAIGVGDSTQARNKTWLYGNGREVLANGKMIVDLGTHRQPTGGPREDTVTQILEGR